MVPVSVEPMDNINYHITSTEGKVNSFLTRFSEMNSELVDGLRMVCRDIVKVQGLIKNEQVVCEEEEKIFKANHRTEQLEMELRASRAREHEARVKADTQAKALAVLQAQMLELMQQMGKSREQPDVGMKRKEATEVLMDPKKNKIDSKAVSAASVLAAGANPMAKQETPVVPKPPVAPKAAPPKGAKPTPKAPERTSPKPAVAIFTAPRPRKPLPKPAQMDEPEPETQPMPF